MKTVFCLTTISLLSTSLLAGNWYAIQEADVPAVVSAGQFAYQDANAPHAFYSQSIATTRVNPNQEPVNAALRAMKDAADDASRSKAEDELKKALDADYDARLEGYEKHLDQLEEELAKMRDQLQKRKMAKSAMVDLRLQVLKAESDDLGWPGEVDPRGTIWRMRSGSSDPATGVWSTSGPDPFAPAAATPAAPSVRAVRSGSR